MANYSIITTRELSYFLVVFLVGLRTVEGNLADDPDYSEPSSREVDRYGYVIDYYDATVIS